MDLLPREIVDMIFTYFDYTTHIVCELVCRGWLMQSRRVRAMSGELWSAWRDRATRLLSGRHIVWDRPGATKLFPLQTRDEVISIAQRCTGDGRRLCNLLYAGLAVDAPREIIVQLYDAATLANSDSTYDQHKLLDNLYYYALRGGNPDTIKWALSCGANVARFISTRVYGRERLFCSAAMSGSFVVLSMHIGIFGVPVFIVGISHIHESIMEGVWRAGPSLQDKVRYYLYVLSLITRAPALHSARIIASGMVIASARICDAEFLAWLEAEYGTFNINYYHAAADLVACEWNRCKWPSPGEYERARCKLFWSLITSAQRWDVNRTITQAAKYNGIFIVKLFAERYGLYKHHAVGAACGNMLSTLKYIYAVYRYTRSGTPIRSLLHPWEFPDDLCEGKPRWEDRAKCRFPWGAICKYAIQYDYHGIVAFAAECGYRGHSPSAHA